MPPVVVVRPLSGYANRLQAIVSASLLADELGSELLVCWEESPVAPVPADRVLGPAWCAAHVREADALREDFGIDPREIPSYLSIDDEQGAVTLAGLDLGEQHFMPDLRALLASARPRVLVLSAGGKFTLDGDAILNQAQDAAFRARRYSAYAELPLNPEVETGAAVAASHQPFLGLHLRYSDRSTQTPWRRSVWPAVRAVADRLGTRSVFIASDSGRERDRWRERLAQEGFAPWVTDPGDFPRSDPRSALGALVDWRILSRSRAMVYFAASSFAEEAAVASGHVDDSIGLTATVGRTAWVRLGQYVDAARTYPRRHGLWGSNP